MPYTYIWEWQGRTDRPLRRILERNRLGEDQLRELANTLRYTVIASITDSFEKEFRKKYPDLIVTKIDSEIDITEVDATPEDKLRTLPLPEPLKVYEYWANMKATVYYETKYSIDVGSPIDPATITAIGVVIAKILLALGTVVVAYVAIKKFFEWMESMTTKRSKISEYIYDEEGNLIKTTQEDTTEPNIPGMATIGIFVLIGLALLFFLFMFYRRRR